MSILTTIEQVNDVRSNSISPIVKAKPVVLLSNPHLHSPLDNGIFKKTRNLLSICFDVVVNHMSFGKLTAIPWETKERRIWWCVGILIGIVNFLIWMNWKDPVTCITPDLFFLSLLEHFVRTLIWPIRKMLCWSKLEEISIWAGFELKYE